MLSVAKVGSAGGAAGYYTQEDNYYFLGDASTAWFGKGAEQLGLKGAVDKNQFERVLEGQLPNGSNLTYFKNGQNVHRAGYDLTFSAPKSVSVLALVVGDKDVLAAHQTAVKKALNEIETFSTTRTMIDGVPVQTNTNNLVSALFTHDTSRNLDPQLHTHAIIANVTFDSQQNEWRTLSSDKVSNLGFVETVWKNQVAFGSIYRQFLKEDLIKQGYEIETVGKNGLWEIKGVPTEIFSSRRQEILEATDPNASNRALSVAAKDTRNVKDFSNIEEVKKEWEQKLAETGFKKENIINQTAQPQPPTVEVTKAVEQSIADLAKDNIKFGYDNLLNKVINQVEVKEGVTHQVREAIEQAIQKGDLIAVDKEQTRFTTKTHLENEHSVSTLLSALNNQVNDLKTDSKSVIANHMATDHKNFNLFNVKGGLHYEAKLVEEVRSLADENSKQHIIVVPDKKTKFDLLEQNGWKGDIYTAKDFAKQEVGLGEQNRIVTILRAEKIDLTQMKEVLEKGKDNGDTFAMLDSGGRKGSGLTRDIAHEIGINEVRLNEKAEDKKLIIVENVDKSERVHSAAKLYTSLALHDKKTMLQAAQPVLRDQLTQATREMLLDSGLLSEQSITLKTRQPIYLDSSNMKDRRTYKEGYTLERMNNGKLESFTIQSVGQNNKLSLIDEKGEVSALSISKINGTYNLFKDAELQVHIGEKLKSTGQFRDIYPNKELSVVGINKPHFFFREKIILQDEHGKQFSVPTKERMKLAYNYVESLGASKTGKQENIIAVLNKVDTTSQTVNDIKRGGNNILMITAADKKTISHNVKIDDSQITVTGDLRNLLDADNLKDIQQKAILRASSSLSRLVDVHIEKVTLNSKDKMTFNAISVINSVTAASKNISINEVRQHLAERINKGDLVAIDRDSTLSGNFVTRESVELEKNILSAVEKGKGAAQPLLNNIDSVDMQKLTQGQRSAATMILTSADKINLVQGYAGVGKTTLLKTVTGALHTQRADIELIGLAPTHTAVKEMRNAGAHNASTIQQFLHDQYSKSGGNTKNEFANKVFVIDESSMIGNKDMASLIDTIIGGGGRIVLSGDYAQLKSLDSGTPMKLVFERGDMDKTTVSEIVRQEPHLKSAVEYTIKGAVPRALGTIAKLDPLLVERRDIETMPTSSLVDMKEVGINESIDMLVRDFVGRTDSERSNTVVITPTNATKNTLNKLFHDGLKEQGDLGNSLTVPVYDQINMTKADIKDASFWRANVNNVLKQGQQYFRIQEATSQGEISVVNLANGELKLLDSLRIDDKTSAVYRERRIELSENDKVRITATDKDRVISNNAFGIIDKIENDKISVKVGDKVVTYDPKNENSDRHLDYGYTITPYASQGGSFRNVISVIDNPKLGALDSFYVQVSRGIHHFQSYIYDIPKHVERIFFNNSGDRPTATEILEKKGEMQRVAAESENVRNVRQEWGSAQELNSVKFSDKLPPKLVENGHFIGEKSEIILQVLNDEGSHRGNYHLPVNPYRGEVDFEKGYYQGANDGNLIVLNQGDEQKEVKNFHLTDLDKAIMSDTQEQSIIIKLNDKDALELLTNDKISNNINSELTDATQIYSELQKEDEKLLSTALNEIAREDKAEQSKDIENNQKTRLGNDEVNILTHKNSELNQVENDKIKEKELV